MHRFVAATKNLGKLAEIREILAGMPFDVISMDEAGASVDIDESGSTFEENAMIKAKAVYEITGGIVMADDSGLEVDYLNGAPGVFSSRFAGEGAGDPERNDKLLGLLEGVPFEQRKARFVCAVAIVLPGGGCFTVRGACEGYIGVKPEGSNGFGYDPLFYMPEYGMTTARMSPSQKHEVSHRGKALRMMVEKLSDLAEKGEI